MYLNKERKLLQVARLAAFAALSAQIITEGKLGKIIYYTS